MMTVTIFNGKHTVKVSDGTFSVYQSSPKKKSSPVDKNPKVKFSYPSKDFPYSFTERTVRLITADNKYLIGLDIGDKNRFKKFSRNRIPDDVRLIDFNMKPTSTKK